MRRVVYPIAVLFFLANYPVFASDGENPLEQSSMLRSWFVGQKPTASKDLDPQFFFTGEMDEIDLVSEEHTKHNTTYMSIVATASDPLVYKLLEKCLVTYCKLKITEQKYNIQDDLKNALDKFESYPLQNIQEYKDGKRFSKGMNTWLPARDTRIMWVLRVPFSSRWPTIDMYSDIERLRAHCPIAADYVDYLFKANPPDLTSEKLASRAIENCKQVLSGLELLTLFAMHAFGHGNMRDLDLANLEAGKLAHSFGATPASAIYAIMRAQSEAQDEFFYQSDGAEIFGNILSDGEIVEEEYK